MNDQERQTVQKIGDKLARFGPGSMPLTGDLEFWRALGYVMREVAGPSATAAAAAAPGAPPKVKASRPSSPKKSAKRGATAAAGPSSTPAPS